MSGLLHHPDIPFTHFACHLPEQPSGDQLLKAYRDLYQAARHSVDDYIGSNPQELELHSTESGDSPISYNLAMTTRAMAICPRRREGDMLRRDDGTEIGFVALNGTILAGTLMVKHQEQWDVLQQQPEKLDALLKAIGIPSHPKGSALRSHV